MAVRARVAILPEKFHFDVTVHSLHPLQREGEKERERERKKKTSSSSDGIGPRGIRKGDIVRKCRGLKRPQAFSNSLRLVRFASNCNIFTPDAVNPCAKLSRYIVSALKGCRRDEEWVTWMMFMGS